MTNARRKPCRFKHKWKLAKNSGVYKYYECTICNARKFKAMRTGHQPLRTDWLAGLDVRI